jgi:hypothetical protein
MDITLNVPELISSGTERLAMGKEMTFIKMAFALTTLIYVEPLHPTWPRQSPLARARGAWERPENPIHTA